MRCSRRSKAARLSAGVIPPSWLPTIMTKEELQQRGLRSISDALFIKDEIIPRAERESRWNMVVFECFRVAEIMIKAIICLSGHTPRHIHDLDSLLSGLVGIVDKSGDSPFYIAHLDDRDNWYGVSVVDEGVEVFVVAKGDLYVIGQRVDKEIEKTLSTFVFT